MAQEREGRRGRQAWDLNGAASYAKATAGRREDHGRVTKLVYQIITICQGVNKSFACWRLEARS